MKTAVAIVSLTLGVLISQASQVQWTTTKVQDKNGDPISGGVAYLFNTADYADAAALSSAVTGGTIDYSKAVVSTTTSATGGINVKSGSLSYEGSQTFIGLIFDSATAGSGSFVVTSPKPVTMKGTGATSVATGSMAGATWTPVPEPTTVALLALGLAALGLKRKVA